MCDKIIIKNECRTCVSNKLKIILDLGMQPLANDFHDNNKILDKYPLKLMLCEDCFHLQLSHVVNPDILYKNYIYISGTSSTIKIYFQWLSNYINNRINLDDKYNKKILEIACNDATQLDCFKMLNNWQTIGVDPAENIYNTITKYKDHDIYCDYWNKKIMLKIKEKYKNVDVILCQNVFGHTDNIQEFLQNCYEIMYQNSLLYIQVSQARMVHNNEYDTVYHEHLSFFCINSMNIIANRNNLYIKNVKVTDIHGMSFLFELSKNNKYKNDVLPFLKEENDNYLHDIKRYIDYSNICLEKGKKLKDTINEYKNKGYKIISYGASAKGNTLLNHLDIKNIDYIVDDNELKWGKYTPGTNIEIKDPNFLLTEYSKKIVIVMLTWNFEKEIKDKIYKLGLNPEYILYGKI